MSLGEDSVETMNILYESVDISDVDIEKDKSLTYSNGDCSLNGAEQMNEHGFTKKGNIRRYLLRFVSTSLGFLTLFAVAVFMDLHLNDKDTIYVYPKHNKITDIANSSDDYYEL